MENKEKMVNGKEVCPCCDKHCPVDKLHCSKGKEHFGIAVDDKERENRHHGECRRSHGKNREDRYGRKEHEHGNIYGDSEHGEAGMFRLNEESMDVNEISMALLLQCGHFLHHNKNHDKPDCKKMFEVLTKEEHDQLNLILKKCLSSWH